ncbi:MAG: hypothetical protein LLF98_01800 [Clostridium sp.]|uniref:hypothetical protein n=1 Tax=Clostridium sp. TaxID=1506 RepID=UPI0025B84A99|nr:hypothetical protein [Clostridium sp.]MCE5220014.1 hypothetical protein [Clostridium sp.]
MTLELVKKQCSNFGNPSAMFKDCVNCFHNNGELWVMCMNYKNGKVKKGGIS